MLKFTKRLPIELTNGKIFEVRMPSIVVIEEWRATYNLLAIEINNPEYKNLDLIQAYSSKPIFKKYLNDLLTVIGLDFEKVPADTLQDLLFPHQTPDGGYERQGSLVKFICGEVQGGSKASKEEVDAYARSLAQLWHASSSFKDALEVLNHLSYEDLNKVLEERAELAKSPEEKIKEKAKERAIKAKDTLMEQLGAKPGQKFKLGAEVDINSLMK